MRIHHQRVGSIASVEHVPHLGQYRCGAAVGCIDVQPHLLPVADLGNRCDRIDRSCRGRAYCGDDREWNASESPIVLDLGHERSRLHSQRGVSRNFSESLEPETQSHHRFVHARVRLLRAIDNHPRQIRTS